MKFAYGVFIVSALFWACSCTLFTSSEAQVLMKTTSAIVEEYDAVATGLDELIDVLLIKDPTNDKLVIWKKELNDSQDKVAALAIEIKNMLETTITLNDEEKLMVLEILEKVIPDKE
jgi:hypothetical protein